MMQSKTCCYYILTTLASLSISLFAGAQDDLDNEPPEVNSSPHISSGAEPISIEIVGSQADPKPEERMNVSRDEADASGLVSETVPEYAPYASEDNDETGAHVNAGFATPDSLSTMPALPGEDIHFKLKLHTSTHHMIDGRVESDIGKILFKSRLMPSNEVKLSLTLKHRELEDIQLLAYLDLANFTMELDGANSILSPEHKQLLDYLSLHLRSGFGKQYDGYDFPEHALMLVQMTAYWSVSPEGYVHEKRLIVSQ